MTKDCLNSKVPLVEAVTEWLTAKAERTPSGVPALDYMVVLVPTRQAGRRLREALAEAFPSGCIPPKTLPASSLLQPSRKSEKPVITQAESIALLTKILQALNLPRYSALFPEKGHPNDQNFSWALAIAEQLHQLWNALAESALVMADVSGRIEEILVGEDLDVEIERWRDLAALELLFFESIKERGLTPMPIAIKEVVASPTLPAGCRELILPALVDGVPALYQALENIPPAIKTTILIQFDGKADLAFDDRGVPRPEFWNSDAAPVIKLDDNQIYCARDSAEQARRIAAYFDNIPEREALPALGIADANLFTELESAFLNRGLRIHNPAGAPLSASSLARLIRQIRDFRPEASFRLLASFLRQADTIRLLELKSHEHTQLIQALDQIQNARIPQSVSETLKFCRDDLDLLNSAPQLKSYEKARLPGLELLKKTIEFLVSQTTMDAARSPVEQLIAKLKLFFKGRMLTDVNTIDRELAAAASKILDLRESLQSPLILETLSGHELSLLFDEMLQSGAYQLEAAPGTDILTEGWLELIWNPAAEIIISGFNEGSIPVAVVGHAFLPDRLRKALNMVCNDLRAARDTYLLYALANARQPGAVQIHLERVSAAGDARKPSRLLFKCDDQRLAARARRLFSESESRPPERPRALPETWKLNFPPPSGVPTPKSLSVSSVSDYLKCPFTFYLNHILNMEERDDRAEEMEPMVFGTLCHEAIELFGDSPLKTSTDPAEISRFLAERVYSLAKRQYGSPMPAVIQLQTRAAVKRLAFFAEEQAQRTSKGWRISAGEERLSYTVDDIEIRGRADRIDFHPDSNTVQIIDFKTWNKAPKDHGKAKFATRARAMVEYATDRGLRLYALDDKEGYAITDMQLHLYMLMMPAKHRQDANTKIECAYFVLGESRPECRCFAWNLDKHRADLLGDLKLLIKNIKHGLFWPPSPLEQWKYNHAKLFLDEPTGEISADWLKDQRQRITRARRRRI